MALEKHRLGVLVAIGLAALIAVSPIAMAQAPDTPATLTHGPMLGHVTSGGIRIWARTSRPAMLGIQYGLRFSDLDQRTKEISTDLATDMTGAIPKSFFSVLSRNR